MDKNHLRIRTTSASIRGRIGIAVQNLLLDTWNLLDPPPFTKEQLDAELPWDCCPVGHITYGSRLMLATPMQSSGGPVRPAGVEAVVPVERRGACWCGACGACPTGCGPCCCGGCGGVGCGACCRGACACCGAGAEILGKKASRLLQLHSQKFARLRKIRSGREDFDRAVPDVEPSCLYVATRSEPHQYFFKVTSDTWC